MQHRIRGAGIAIQNDSVLLVKHRFKNEVFWVPPGGGLEPQDHNTKESVIREFHEETGLTATVGQLIYIREFKELSHNTYHAEFFYLIDSLSGTITMKNLTGLGGDEFAIEDVQWIHKDDIHSLIVYPEALYDDFWRKVEQQNFTLEYLGMIEEKS